MTVWRIVIITVTGAVSACSMLALPGAAVGDPSRLPESQVPGLPSGVPLAGLREEPSLLKPAGWPFGEVFPRTSGTGRLAGGAAFWTDYLYDDHGPFTGGYQNVYTGAADGGYSYPAGPAAGNGADVFRSAVGIDSHASYWRVDWTTLVDADVPIAEWAVDSDANPATGTSAWTAGAGLTSPGIDHTLLVSSQKATLTDTITGQTVDVTPGLSVDKAARSFVVRIPLSVLPLSGKSVIRLASGLSNPAGEGFAPVASEQGGSSSLPPVYNVSYRSIAQEPPSYSGTANPWNDDDQASTLAATGADVSKFSTTIDWSALAVRATTPEPKPRGISDRWYVSQLVPGQGVRTNVGYGDIRPVYLSRVQPYAVYVPQSWNGSSPLAVTWLLHSTTQTHNQYTADGSILQNFCESRNSLCVTTEGFGPNGWYFDQADAEVFEVWRQLALTYPLDTEHTTIGGYSMGGYAAYKLGTEYPDLFADAFSMEGPVNCGGGTNGPINTYGQQGRCASGADGDTQPLLVNARWLPFMVDQSTEDEFVPYETVARQMLTLDQLGYRYHFETATGGEHLTEGSLDSYKKLAEAVGTTRVRTSSAGQFTYSWYSDEPDQTLGTGAQTLYWLDGLDAREKAPGKLASIAADDGALPSPSETANKTETASTVSGVPLVVVDNQWQSGPTPAATSALILKLSDVRTVSVDAAAARLPTGRATVTTDGTTTLRLENLPAGATVSVDGRAVSAQTAETAGILLAAGTTQITWSSAGAFVASCPAASGRLAGLTLGPVRLGEPRAVLRRRLRSFSTRGRHDMDFFCQARHAGIRVGYPSPSFLRTLSAYQRARVRGRAVLALTSSRFYRLEGVSTGTRLVRVARRLHIRGGFRVGLNAWYRVGLNAWYFVPRRLATGVLKVRHGVIEEIGIADERLTAGRAAAWRFLRSFD